MAEKSLKASKKHIVVEMFLTTSVQTSPDGCSWTPGCLPVHFTKSTTIQSRIRSAGKCPNEEKKEKHFCSVSEINTSQTGKKMARSCKQKIGQDWMSFLFELIFHHPSGCIFLCSMNKARQTWLSFFSCHTNKITACATKDSSLFSHLAACGSSPEVAAVVGEQAVQFSWSNIVLKRARPNLSLMWVMTVNMRW